MVLYRHAPNKAALLDGVAETNPNGSGILLGHPVAATGAILVVKALAPR
jgi:acetyl-CoA acetyltransferase